MFCRVTLLGRLTRDAEVKEAKEGRSLIRLRVAYNRRKRSKTGEWKEDPVFLSVSFFTSNTDYYKDKLKKGTLVLIDGEIRQYRNDNDGIVTEISARRVIPIKPSSKTPDENTSPVEEEIEENIEEYDFLF